MSYKRFLVDYGTYHVYNRGNNKENIFSTEFDKNVFYQILKQVQEKFNFVIYGQCLMRNHFHLVIFDVKRLLPDYMGLLQEDFAIFYNSTYNRTGQVFECPFKSNPVTSVSHLFNLLCYTANNPVAAGIAANYTDYIYSARYHLGYDNYNLIDYQYINYLSLKYNRMPIHEYISMHKSKGLISQLELERICDNDAKVIFSNIVKTLIGSDKINLKSIDECMRTKIIQEACYFGLSIRQVMSITGFSEFYIKKRKSIVRSYL